MECSARQRSVYFGAKKCRMGAFYVGQSGVRADAGIYSAYGEKFEPEDDPSNDTELETPGVVVPAISVIIPMYNMEVYIEECLTSVLNQTFTDYEVIVVDDCSKDRSAEIVEGMMPKFGGRLKFIQLSKNTGAAATPRNVGTSLAIGKYLYFIDSDDMIAENALEVFYTAAEMHKADVVCNGIHYLIELDGRITLKDFFKIKHPVFSPCDLTQRTRDFTSRLAFSAAPWRKFVRRSWFVKNKLSFSPAYICDDTLVSFQYAACARIYVFIPDVVYFWRVRETSSIHAKYAILRAFEKQVYLVSVVFRALNDFMNRFEFFSQHPRSKFIMNACFFRYFMVGVSLRYMQRYYHSNPIGLIYEIKYNLLSEGKVIDDHWIAYIVAATNFQSDQLQIKEQQLEKLKSELKLLKSTE